MFASANLLVPVIENTNYNQTVTQVGRISNDKIVGNVIWGLFIAQNTLTTQYIRIWAKNNNDTDLMPPLMPITSLKQGSVLEVVFQKFIVYTDSTGLTPYSVTSAQLNLVGMC